MAKNDMPQIERPTNVAAEAAKPKRAIRYAYLRVTKKAVQKDGSMKVTGGATIALRYDANQAPQRIPGLSSSLRSLLNVDVDLVPGKGFEATLGSSSRITLEPAAQTFMHQSAANYVVEAFAVAKGLIGSGIKNVVSIDVADPLPEDEQ